MKNRPAKVFALLVMSVFSLALIAGCGGGAVPAPSDGNAAAPSGPAGNGTPAKDAIKIDQVPWTISNVVEGSQRRVGVTYENRSSYPIAELKLTYKVKPGTTLEEISPAFLAAESENSLLTKYFEDLTDESDENLSKLEISADFGIVVNPGETSAQDLMGMNTAYLTNDNQLEFFELDMVTMKFLEEDKLYTETYDSMMGSYSISSDVADTADWPENDFTAQLPTPDGLIIEDTEIIGDYFTFDITGATVKEFADYVSKCEAQDFNTDVDRIGDSAFYGTNAETGYKLGLNYIDGSISGFLNPVE